MSKSINQAEIAVASGFSRQTVSFALNEHLCFRLNPLTRQHVLDTAQRLGYVPHRAARRLARERAESQSRSFDQVGLISILPRNVEMDWVCHAMMGGAENELSRLHASIFFVRISEDADWEKVERMTRAGGVDGWLVYGPVNDEVMNRLDSSKLPSVILGDHRCMQPVHSVNVDNEGVGSLAVDHLAGLGHRRIGFFSGRMNFLYQEQILVGFRAAVKESGLDIDDRLIVRDASLGNKDGEDRLRQWVCADPAPTALFVPEVDMAVALMGVLKDLRIEVPKTLSVLTTDPVSVIARNQGYSRIEFPMIEVGRRGSLVLHDLVSKRREEFGEMKISSSLAQGWSTSPPSSPRVREGGSA